jgi:hypothetical protein
MARSFVSTTLVEILLAIMSDQHYRLDNLSRLGLNELKF